MRSRGFTMWIAILLMGSAAVVIGATMSLVSTDVRRTATDASDAQLRQYLLAGQAVAMEDLARDGVIKDRDIPTPNEGRLTLKPTGDGKATVIAEQAGRRHEQTLAYVRHGSNWRLANALLP